MSEKTKEKSGHGHGTGHIIQSLIVNSLIAVAKGVAAFITGSGAMLAETIHSVADCANQGLLLLGVKQSKRPPSEEHPFGYGRSSYFWSFMVAMLLFSVGGMFSIYEGVHKYTHPEPIDQVWWGIGVLAFAIILEAYATWSNIKIINKRREGKGFMKYLKSTKDSDLVVVFGENSAACLGLILALAALTTAYYTGDPRFDAIGSFAIGLVLIFVAIFLAIEVKSLLLGERADPEIYETIKNLISQEPEMNGLLECKTVQQGPGEVMACMKIEFQQNLKTSELNRVIDDFETKLRNEKPDIRWLYIEPDYKA